MVRWRVEHKAFISVFVEADTQMEAIDKGWEAVRRYDGRALVDNHDEVYIAFDDDLGYAEKEEE